MDQGFDEFFGFTDAVHAWEKFPKVLWDGRELKPVTGYADDLFTDRAVDFLERHQGRTRSSSTSPTSPPTFRSRLPTTRSRSTAASSPRPTRRNR